MVIEQVNTSYHSPNREVKPCIADDTAIPSGKVGRCQIKPRASSDDEALFLYPHSREQQKEVLCKFD